MSRQKALCCKAAISSTQLKNTPWKQDLNTGKTPPEPLFREGSKKTVDIRQVSWLSRYCRLPIRPWHKPRRNSGLVDSPLHSKLSRIEVITCEGIGITVAGPLRIRTGIPWLLRSGVKIYCGGWWDKDDSGHAIDPVWVFLQGTDIGLWWKM